jgi:hypothetical protein
MIPLFPKLQLLREEGLQKLDKGVQQSHEKEGEFCMGHPS